MSRDEAIYNIGVVARMTDIPAATLRIWERRYDFPDSARTDGGHRLYSEHEIERLKWVKANIDRGMQTGQAIKALRLQEKETALAFDQQQTPTNTIQHEQAETAESYLIVLKNRLTSLLIANEMNKASAVFDEALAHASPEDIMLQIIRPILYEIGERWEKGEISVSTEHLVSNYLRQHLTTWMRYGPPPYKVPPAVLACAPGEWHEGGLMILGALLTRRRWPVAYLGQSVPLQDLATFVKEIHPMAVVFSATTEDSAKALQEWPKCIGTTNTARQPAVAYGGHIFNAEPSWRSKTPGVFLGTTLTEGVQTLEQILQKAAAERGISRFDMSLN